MGHRKSGKNHLFPHRFDGWRRLFEALLNCWKERDRFTSEMNYEVRCFRFGKRGRTTADRPKFQSRSERDRNRWRTVICYSTGAGRGACKSAPVYNQPEVGAEWLPHPPAPLPLFQPRRLCRNTTVNAIGFKGKNVPKIKFAGTGRH